MNKILVEKDTDMVSQIINIDDGYEFNPYVYGDNFYVVDDENNEISTYNLKYVRTRDGKGGFQVVEGVEALPGAAETVSELRDLQEQVNHFQALMLPAENEMEALRQENEDLKYRLRLIEEKLGL